MTQKPSSVLNSLINWYLTYKLCYDIVVVMILTSKNLKPVTRADKLLKDLTEDHVYGDNLHDAILEQEHDEQEIDFEDKGVASLLDK